MGNVYTKKKLDVIKVSNTAVETSHLKGGWGFLNCVKQGLVYRADSESPPD